MHALLKILLKACFYNFRLELICISRHWQETGLTSEHPHRHESSKDETFLMQQTFILKFRRATRYTLCNENIQNKSVLHTSRDYPFWWIYHFSLVSENFLRSFKKNFIILDARPHVCFSCILDFLSLLTMLSLLGLCLWVSDVTHAFGSTVQPHYHPADHPGSVSTRM